MEDKKGHFSGGRTYRGDDITVYWKPSACVHASYCYRELIEVFDPGRRPWVDMKAATTARIIEVVNMCPTEALTWKWNDDARNIDINRTQSNHVKFMRPELMGPAGDSPKEPPVSVKIMIDGPIIVKGDFKLKYSGNEKDMKDGMISICRCGNSGRMPFCDGRHRHMDFEG